MVLGIAVIRPVRSFVLWLDAFLRNRYGIYEYTTNPDCVFRVSITDSDDALTLSDGTVIHLGDRIGELHFWNEHIPQIGEDGPTLAWARTFQRQMYISLLDLVEHVRVTPAFDRVVAFRGVLHFGNRKSEQFLKRALKRWDFDLQEEQPPNHRAGLAAFWSRFAGFWENFYLLALIWAFNQGSLIGKNVQDVWTVKVWISQEKLLHDYGQPVKQSSNEAQSIDVTA